MGPTWVSVDVLFASVEARDLAELTKLRRRRADPQGPSARHVKAGKASGEARSRCPECRRTDPTRRRGCTHRDRKTGAERREEWPENGAESGADCPICDDI